MVNDHDPACFRYRELKKAWNIRQILTRRSLENDAFKTARLLALITLLLLIPAGAFAQDAHNGAGDAVSVSGAGKSARCRRAD